MIHFLTNSSVLFHSNFKSRNPKLNTQSNYRIYLKEMSMSWIDVKIERTAKKENLAIGHACWSVSERYENVTTPIYAIKRAAASNRQALFLTFSIRNGSQTDPFLVVDISINSTFYSEHYDNNDNTNDLSALLFSSFESQKQKQILMWKSTVNFISNKTLHIICLSTEPPDIQINRKNLSYSTLAAYWYTYVTGFDNISDAYTSN